MDHDYRITPFQSLLLVKAVNIMPCRNARCVAACFKGVSLRTIQRQMQSLRKNGFLSFSRSAGWELTICGIEYLSKIGSKTTQHATLICER